MAKKVVLPYQNFKRIIGAGTAKLTNFLVAQRIGKVEFTSKPWSLDKSGGDRITKWVVDLENGKFLKLVNGEVDYQEKRTVGEAIGEIGDLIGNEKVNDYSSVTLYRRTSIPGKTSDKFSNESRKNMKPKKIGLMQIVETIVRREIAAKRKINESSASATKKYTLYNAIAINKLEQFLAKTANNVEKLNQDAFRFDADNRSFAKITDFIKKYDVDDNVYIISHPLNVLVYDSTRDK